MNVKIKSLQQICCIDKIGRRQWSIYLMFTHSPSPRFFTLYELTHVLTCAYLLVGFYFNRNIRRLVFFSIAFSHYLLPLFERKGGFGRKNDMFAICHHFFATVDKSSQKQSTSLFSCHLAEKLDVECRNRKSFHFSRFHIHPFQNDVGKMFVILSSLL